MGGQQTKSRRGGRDQGSIQARAREALEERLERVLPGEAGVLQKLSLDLPAKEQKARRKEAAESALNHEQQESS